MNCINHDRSSSCTLFSKIRSKDKQHAHHYTSASQEQLPSYPITNDLEWVLQSLDAGNMLLHNVSFYQHQQPISGGFLESENSLWIHLSNTMHSHEYFSRFLALLAVEDKHRSLKNLEFRFVEWEPKELEQLQFLIDGNNNIKQLVFHKNFFTIQGVALLSDSLGRSRGIQILIFFECRIGSSGVGLLASALKTNEMLKELQILEDCIGLEGAEELSKMIEVNSTLKVLTIEDNDCTSATSLISTVVGRNRIMEIHIWNRNGTEGSLKVVEFSPDSSTLRIHRVNPLDARRITIALGWNTTIKTLDMAGVKLNSKWAKDFRMILENNRTLKVALLSKTGLKNKAIVYIAAGLFKNHILEFLELDDNSFSGIGVEHLLCPLTKFPSTPSQGNHTLKSVTFGGNKTKITGKGKVAILQMISTNQSILSLGIHNDNSLKPYDIIKIFRSMERNVTLRKLSLRGCKGVEGELVMQAIKETLQINPWLEEIDLSGTPLEDAGMTESIYQKLGQNARTNIDKDISNNLPLTKPVNCRAFLCGQNLAGKTTLCNSLAANFSGGNFPYWNEIKALVNPVEGVFSTPEITVKTLQDDDIKISIWELPGQQKFYALHDLLFPGLGSPCLFFIVASLFRRSDGREPKTYEEIEDDLMYWLRFIVSNSRSKAQVILPSVTVIFTHFDKLSHESEKLYPVINMIERLKVQFQGFVDFYTTAFAVDARSSTSVSKLAHHLRKTCKMTLERVPQIYKVCVDLMRLLREWRNDNHNKPVMRWSQFCELCQMKVPTLRIRWRYGDNDVESRRRAVVQSLHTVGELMFFQELELIILDLEWFYNNLLLQLLRLAAGKMSIRETKGFISKKELERIILENHQRPFAGPRARVFNYLNLGDLIQMMLKLEFCYEQNPGDAESLLLIPAILEEGIEQARKWHCSKSDSIYMGRRMECDDKGHMFLTAGVFPRLQVQLRNKIFRMTDRHIADYIIEKYLISATINGVQVKVELSEKCGYFIDIMACTTKSSNDVLRLFHHQIIPIILNLAPGMNLTESIIRPDCIKYLLPSRYRKDQYIPLKKLKQTLLSISAEGLYEYQHTWSSVSDGINCILQPGFSYARDLLSDDEIREVLNQRYNDLHQIASELSVRVNNAKNQNPEVEKEPDFEIEPSLAGLAKGVKAVIDKLLIIETEIKDLKKEIQSLRYYEEQLLTELNRKVEYLVNYNIHLEERKIPQMFYLVQNEYNSKRLITRVIPGMTGLRLHMLCEYRGELHVIEDQIGCELMQINNQAVRSILPYLSGFMKLLTFSLKIGAHLVAGIGEMIPDLSKEFVHLLSSSAAYGTAVVAAGATGMIAAGQLQGSKTKNQSAFVGPTSRNLGQDITAARQWLMEILRERKILSGKGIAETFGLWRVRYRDNGQIAWICRRHREMRAYHIIEFPT